MKRSINMIRLLYVGLLSVTLLGCDTASLEVNDEVDTRVSHTTLGLFELSLGKQVELDSSGFAMTFESVLEDSRCPEPLLCFWAGRAVVRLVLIQPGSPTDTLDLASFALSEGDTSTAVRNGYRFQFLDLTPYPVEGEPTDPATYHAVVQVDEE